MPIGYADDLRAAVGTEHPRELVAGDWRYVLEVWSGRRTGLIRLMDGLAVVMSLPRRFRRTTTDPRDEAGGELPAGS